MRRVLRSVGVLLKVSGLGGGFQQSPYVRNKFIVTVGRRLEAMLRRVNLMVLLGLVVVLVLSFAIAAGAQLTGDTMVGPVMGVQEPVGVEGLVGVEEPVGVEPLAGGGFGALGVAEAQLGKPFVWGTDGPDTFSCSGLVRYALMVSGIDADAPFVPEEYLGRYAPVAPGNLLPGDVVIYPDWATMYAGNDMLISANQLEGVVTYTPMEYAGEPLGIVRP